MTVRISGKPLLLAVLLLASCKDTAEEPTAADATMQQGIEASVEDVTAAEAAMRGPAPATEETKTP